MKITISVECDSIDEAEKVLDRLSDAPDRPPVQPVNKEVYPYRLETVQDVINNLRDLREERGLSQADLARMTGLSASTISNIENNESRPFNVRASTKKKIAHALVAGF